MDHVMKVTDAQWFANRSLPLSIQRFARVIVGQQLNWLNRLYPAIDRGRRILTLLLDPGLNRGR